MYIISVLILIIISVLSAAALNVSILSVIDAASLVYIVLICIPILAGTGQLKDLNNAFKYAVKTKRQKETVEMAALIRSRMAVGFTIKLLWTAGIFVTVLSIVCSFANAGAASDKAIAYIGVRMIPILYVSFFNLLLLPVKMRLELRISDNRTAPDNILH